MNDKLMIVVPAFNEQECLPELIKRIDSTALLLKNEKFDLTLVVIDDCSTDNSWEILQNSKTEQLTIVGIRLACNVGHQQALWEGLLEFGPEYSALIFMDADLQDPPEVIPSMLRIWKNNPCDLVVAVRSDRGVDSRFKRISSSLFYSVMSFFSESTQRKNMHNAGDFRLIDKSIAQSLQSLSNKNELATLRFLTIEVAKKIETVSFVRGERFGGDSKYGLPQMFKLAANSVLQSRHLSHRVLQFFSIVTGLSSLILAAYIVSEKYLKNQTTFPGWLSLTIISLSGIFIQSTLLLLLSSEVRGIRKSLSLPRSSITNSLKSKRFEI